MKIEDASPEQLESANSTTAYASIEGSRLIMDVGLFSIPCEADTPAFLKEVLTLVNKYQMSRITSLFQRP